MILRLALAVPLALGGTGLAAADDWKSLYEAGVEADDYADWNAIAAARKWRFNPSEHKGKAVKVRATIEVHFRVR